MPLAFFGLLKNRLIHGENHVSNIIFERFTTNSRKFSFTLNLSTAFGGDKN